MPQGVLRCGACLRHPPAMEACLAGVTYAYPWAGLIAEFKFHGHPAWARTLAGLLRLAPGVAQALEAADIVLPVPLSRGRLRERGFDQAAWLARALDARKTRKGVLLRLHDTSPQSRLTREERLRNLRGAFAIDPASAPQLQGRRVVLVDDVMTTGATLNAACHPLRQAGAAHITAVVFARTPPP